VTAVNEKIAWVAEYTWSIYRTTDGGTTWTRQPTNPNIPLADISFVGSYH